MPGFDVDPTELFAAGARVSEAAVEGRESTSRVRLEADELFESGWTGRAAVAFRSGFEEWLSGTAQLLAGLDELSAALTAAGHDYERAETSSHGQIGRLAS